MDAGLGGDRFLRRSFPTQLCRHIANATVFQVLHELTAMELGYDCGRVACLSCVDFSLYTVPSRLYFLQ